jgi:hypothetical protein
MAEVLASPHRISQDPQPECIVNILLNAEHTDRLANRPFRCLRLLCDTSPYNDENGITIIPPHTKCLKLGNIRDMYKSDGELIPSV